MRKRIAHVVRHVHKHLSRTDTVMVASAALVLVVAFYSLWVMNAAMSELGAITRNMTGGTGVLEDALALPKISAAVIGVANCTGCVDFSPFLASLANQTNLTVSNVAYDSAEGRGLVQRYNITNLPAIIFTGEVNKSQTVAGLLSNARKSGDAHIAESASPPYYLVSEGRVAGIVDIMIVNISGCERCLPPDVLVSQLREANVSVGSVITYDYNSSEGQAAIARYNMTKLPGIVFSGDLMLYNELNGLPDLSKVLSSASGGNLVWSYYSMPYREADTGNLRGAVEMVMLNDSSCTPCYDVTTNQQGVQQLGVYVINTTMYDISSTEGRALVARYNVTKVPTFLLSPEASIYGNVGQVWPNLGTIEADGWYVFRNMDALNGATYKDLENGTIIITEPQAG